MAHEIIHAAGLSVAFFGIMLSIVAIGVSFFAYKILKKKKPELIKMSFLIASWAIVIFLSIDCPYAPDYKPIFLAYSLFRIFSIILGTIIVLIFFIMLPKFFGKFDKKLLIIAPIFAVLSILEEIIFPFFGNPYLGLIQKITIIIPSLLGFFMMIKLVIGGEVK